MLNLTASDLLQLHADNPEAVRKYLVPMFVGMTGRNVLRPGAADVYSVFSEIPADPTAAGSVAKLLPALDSELFSYRDAASIDLAKLGTPGVLAALRLNRERLSTEQKARIDSFLATERRRSLDDPTTMRKDIGFLLDALEDDDRMVRLAAKASLEAVTGHRVDFDVSLPAEKRGDAIDTVRLAIKQEGTATLSSPTTRPHGVREGLVRPLEPLWHLLPRELISQ